MNTRPERALRVIITGASRGIGRGIAMALARRGHLVGLTARDENALVGVVDAISSTGGRAAAAGADLCDARQVRVMMATLIEALHGVDAIVVNAGVVLRKPFIELSDDEWYELFDTNVHGAFHSIRAALPSFLEQRAGHIINISSISGRLPLAGGSAYAATKYAMTGLSDSLFLELREHGIKVTTVFPGSVATERRAGEGESQDWKVTPEEVGDACAAILETSPRNVISQLEIRPLQRAAPAPRDGTAP